MSDTSVRKSLLTTSSPFLTFMNAPSFATRFACRRPELRGPGHAVLVHDAGHR